MVLFSDKYLIHIITRIESVYQKYQVKGIRNFNDVTLLKMKYYLASVIFFMAIQAFGQHKWQKETIRVQPSVCFASPNVNKSFIAPPVKLKSASTKSTTFIVKYNNFPENAKVAFQYAVDIWKDLIYSEMPIHIEATWETLETDVLGSCSPSNFYYNFDASEKWNRSYAVALAEKMLGAEINSSVGSEIDCSFNSSFSNWYFGTDGNTPADKYDFVSTVMHELCHGLGFHGNFYTERGRGGYGDSENLPSIFDQFVVNKSGQQLVDSKLFTNPSVKLYQNLTSDWLAFNTTLVTDSLPRLYAPTTWDSGSSIYHLNDDSYPSGDPNSLMTHALAKGEAIHSPGPNTLAIMYDMGWKSISIKHKQVKDIELVTEPVTFEAGITSDFDLDSTSLYLVYSSDKFLKKDSVLLKATATPTVFNAKYQPVQNSTVQYYFSATDVKKRRFVYPANSPVQYLSVTTGIDKTSPVVSHEPVSYLLSTDTSVKIDAIVTDNIGIKSVKLEYYINGGLIKELTMVNDSADRYTVQWNFSAGTIKGGDVVNYRIVATDISSQSNVGRMPLTGYNSFKVEGIGNAVDRYVTNFDGTNTDFIGTDFSIATPSGFDTPGLNSAHPYLSPDMDDTEYNFSTILRYPILLNSKGNMSFDEVVLVEPGESGSKFGDDNFWDYVILEGSLDGGKTWKPVIDGYDCNLVKTWSTRWYSSMSGNNSSAVADKELYVRHDINLLANGNFKTGDVVLLRFRLFSDPYSHGWGWIIDNLAIQDLETANNPLLLSSGEIEIYPNPAKENVNIVVSSKKAFDFFDLKVYRSTGILILNQKFSGGGDSFSTEINLGNFTPGLYLFEIRPENGTAISRKVQVL